MESFIMESFIMESFIMESFIEAIWRYGRLSPQEQKEVDQFVLMHPEYAELLQEARAMHVLFEHSGLLFGDPTDETVLAYYIANEHMLAGNPPDLICRAFEQLKKNVESMPKVQARYARIKRRMEDIASHSDPIRQFELLTGHTLGLVSGEEESTGPSRPAPARRRPPERRWPERTHDALPRSTARRGSKSWRLPAAALATLIVACSLIWHVNRFERAGYVAPEELLTEGFQQSIRSPKDLPEDASLTMEFFLANRLLEEAQQTWLNLFYWSDDRRLDEAVYLLEGIAAAEEVSFKMKEESLYLLGKMYLAQRKIDLARDKLLEVEAIGRTRSEDASHLLDRFD